MKSAWPSSIWARAERPYRIGLIGTFLAIAGLLCSVHFHYHWLLAGRSVEPSTPRTTSFSSSTIGQESQANAGEQKRFRVEWGQGQLEINTTTSPATARAAAHPQRPNFALRHPAWDWAAKALGGLAIVLGIWAFIRHEDWRPIFLAFVIGAAAILFSHFVAFLSALITTLIILAIISALLGALG